MAWKKGRGKLGALAPLLGTWVAQADSPQGPLTCERRFRKVLHDRHIELRAVWHIGGGTYEEWALIGADRAGMVRFWSFTSDGKQSQGALTGVTDIHPEAIGFVAEMPAGTARMVYWPADDGGFHWAVESQTKKGWNRFTEHHYHPAPEAEGEIS